MLWLLLCCGVTLSLLVAEGKRAKKRAGKPLVYGRCQQPHKTIWIIDTVFLLLATSFKLEVYSFDMTGKRDWSTFIVVVFCWKIKK